MHETSQALARNTALQVAGKILGTLLSLLTFYLLLGVLGIDGFGNLTTAITYTSLFAILVDFGLTLTTAQMISEDGADEKRILGNLFALRLVTAFCFLALAPVISFALPYSAEVRAAIIGSSIASFFGSVAVLFVGVFQRRLQVLSIVTGELANRLMTMVGIMAIGVWGLGIVGAAYAFAVGSIIQLTVMLLGVRSRVALTLRFEPVIWRSIILRSWPIGVSIFFNLIYLRGDIFFMSIFGRPAAEIGQYGSAYKVIDVMTQIPTLFMGLMLPMLTLLWSQGNKQAVVDKTQTAFNVMALLCLPFAAGAMIVGVALMTFVKPELTDAGRVLAILGPATVAVFFGTLYGHVVLAIQKQLVMLRNFILVAVLAITGYVIFIPLYGMWAAAWVTLISEVLIALLGGILAYRTLGVAPSWTLFLQSLGATGLMSLALYFIPLPHVLLQIAMGVAVYVCSLQVFGGPSPRSLFQLFRSTKAVV